MAATVHHLAQKGFGTGTNELYDRARPSFPPTSISHIRESVRGSAPLNVVEIGSGTGIFTRALLAHPEWKDTVKQLRAVEPSEGMRTQFNKGIQDERVTCIEGTFDSTGVEDGWADVIIIAQAFHWCPDYDKASREFARILKPDGVVALIWNLEDRETAKWVAELRDTIERHESNSPQFRLGLWRATFDTPSYKHFFDPPTESTWSYNLLGTEKIVIDRACSKSYIAVLDDKTKSDVIEHIKEVIKKGEDLVYTDKEKGEFDYPYKTYVVIARKK